MPEEEAGVACAHYVPLGEGAGAVLGFFFGVCVSGCDSASPSCSSGSSSTYLTPEQSTGKPAPKWWYTSFHDLGGHVSALVIAALMD